jgi:hypothetical protein
MAPSESKRTKVFISYSHTDQKWLKRLQLHLRSLSQECAIDVWDDTRIATGSRWRKEIENAVNSAKVAILLVTVDFLGSEFITKNELPPLLEAATADDAIIFPVIIGPCRFSRNKILSQFQPFNPPEKPLAQMTRYRQDKMFVDLTNRIEDLILAQADEPPAPVVEQPPESAPKTDGQKQPGDDLAAIRELILNEDLSKYELLHLKKLAGEGEYKYKMSDTFREELRRLRDKFGFIKNKRGVAIGGLPQAGDLKEFLEITRNGKRFVKMREIFLKEDA